MPASFGKTLIVFGLIFIVAGVLFQYAGRLPFRIGRLPGDLVYRRGNFTFYFPLVTSILLSILLTLLFWAIGRR